MAEETILFSTIQCFYFKNYLSDKINMQMTSAVYFILQGEQQRKTTSCCRVNNSHFMSDIF